MMATLQDKEDSNNGGRKRKGIERHEIEEVLRHKETTVLAVRNVPVTTMHSHPANLLYSFVTKSLNISGA